MNLILLSFAVFAWQELTIICKVSVVLSNQSEIGAPLPEVLPIPLLISCCCSGFSLDNPGMEIVTNRN